MVLSITTSNSLCQFTLDKTLDSFLGTPNLRDLQPSRSHQLVPVSFGSLSRSEIGHHDNIQTGCLPVCVGIRDDILVNQDLAVSWLHDIHKTLQDLAAVIVCPVMEDRVHIVSARTYRRKY